MQKYYLLCRLTIFFLQKKAQTLKKISQTMSSGTPDSKLMHTPASMRRKKRSNLLSDSLEIR